MHKFTIEVESPMRAHEIGDWMTSAGFPGTVRLAESEAAAPIARSEFRLLPYQQAWVDDLSRFKVWDCDRRLGATTAIAAEALAVAVAPDGGSVIVVESSFRDAAELAHGFEERHHKVTRWEKHFIVAQPRWPAIAITWTSTSMEDIDQSLYLAFPGFGPVPPPALVVFDNAGWAWTRWSGEHADDLLRELGREHLNATRVAIVGTGEREGVRRKEWEAFVAASEHGERVRLHVTTARSAIDQGLGKRWCEVNGREWSREFESEWIERIRRNDPKGLAWRL